VTRSSIFVLAVALLFIVLVSASSYYALRARRSVRKTWEELLSRLAPVNRENISLIARDLMSDPHASNDSNQSDLEPGEIWALIGGIEGIEVLEKNCEVLVELAFYVQQWYPDALLISEELRMSAREIQWHLSRLKGAAATGNLEATFPMYAQRAIATYYVMTKSLLDLYRIAKLPMLHELQTAI
jgi:hypothetical protein